MSARTADIIEREDGGRAAVTAVRTSRAERFLLRAVQLFLVVFVLAAPHSIAVAQGAFLAGSVLWIARMIAARRFRFARTAVDLPLAIFVGWTLLSVATGLGPWESLDRMRGVALFFVLYLFASNVATKRFAWVLTLLLALSVMGNLVHTYVERARGVGLEIAAMGPSPLEKWGLREGDVILEVDGRKVRDVAALDAAFDEGKRIEPLAITFGRGDYVMTTEYRRGRVRREGQGVERLHATLAPGRAFRSRGFFSHAATYAETLQLIGAVAVAWVIAAVSRRRWRWAIGMGSLTIAIAGALVQTQTRAPIAAFGLAVVAMALARGGKRAVAAALAAAILVVAIAAGVLYSGRRVSIVEPTDDSTAWRLTVWQEAAGIVRRHPLVGIGPDGAKRHAAELHIFADGKLPPGHFHSTPIQIAVDRGLPALAAWLALVAVLLVALGRLARRLLRDDGEDWRVAAAALGAWGGWIGFVASSAVHFNWGDSEPMQLAWALAGIAFAIAAVLKQERTA